MGRTCGCSALAVGYVQSSPDPALAAVNPSPPAGLVRDATSPADQEWLQERFRIAARKRYQALLTAAELQRPSSPRRAADARGGAVDSPEAVASYGRLEELCRAIMNELRSDDQIRDARVLPGCVNLPDITALEYVNVSGGGVPKSSMLKRRWGWQGLWGPGWRSWERSRQQRLPLNTMRTLRYCQRSTGCSLTLHLPHAPHLRRASSSTCARCCRGTRRPRPPRPPSAWWRRWASCKTL